MSQDTSALIPLAQRFIAGQSVRTVSARELHAFLGVGRDFSTWIKGRIAKYNFNENQDFILVPQNRGTKTSQGGDRRSNDYWLTLDMAKMLAMVENNAMGDQARRYFIACERELNARRRQKALAPPAEPVLPKAVVELIQARASESAGQVYGRVTALLTAQAMEIARNKGPEAAHARLNALPGLSRPLVLLGQEHLGLEPALKLAEREIASVRKALRNAEG